MLARTKGAKASIISSMMLGGLLISMQQRTGVYCRRQATHPSPEGKARDRPAKNNYNQGHVGERAPEVTEEVVKNEEKVSKVTVSSQGTKQRPGRKTLCTRHAC